MVSDPTLRFSNRVDNYIRYRPDYPPEVLDVMRDECGFTPDATVADIGSGTGIFSEALLKHGNPVFGVEPNAAMRAAAERLLCDYPRFTSVDGTAEATTLRDRSVSFITAAQAFHWFNREHARPEFARILPPGGGIVLIWNARRLDSTAFLREYENLLVTYGTDYSTVSERHPDVAQVQAFVGGAAPVALTTLEHHQHFDFDGLRGRLLSSSYAPEPGHLNYEPMLARLAAIFDTYQQGGKVSFDYDTLVYHARLTGHSLTSVHPA